MLTHDRRQERLQLIETLAEDVTAGTAWIDQAPKPRRLGEEVVKRA